MKEQIKNILILFILLFLLGCSQKENVKNTVAKEKPTAIQRTSKSIAQDESLIGYWKNKDNILAFENFNVFELFNKIPSDEKFKYGEYYTYGEYRRIGKKVELYLKNIPSTAPEEITKLIVDGKMELNVIGNTNESNDYVFQSGGLKFVFFGKEY